MLPKPTTEFTVHVFGSSRTVIATLEAPGAPGQWTGHPDTWLPPEPVEITFQIVDEHHHRLYWLEDALLPGQVGAILDEAERRFTESNLVRRFYP